MSEFKDGGPVHPCRIPILGATHLNDEPAPTTMNTGLSIRDYFAAQAMQGLLAAKAGPLMVVVVENLANDAYTVADAMLSARKQSTEESK